MADTATIELHTDDVRGVLEVAGEVDLLTAPYLRDQLESAFHRFGDLVVDLSGVTFFSSAGVDVLAAARLGANTTLSLMDPAPSVRRAFDILGWPEHIRLSAGVVHA